MYLKNGDSHKLYLYKAATLKEMLVKAINRVGGVAELKETPVEEKEKESSDYVEQLEKLAQLHNSGALTDEEFAKAKEKLLK